MTAPGATADLDRDRPRNRPRSMPHPLGRAKRLPRPTSMLEVLVPVLVIGMFLLVGGSTWLTSASVSSLSTHPLGGSAVRSPGDQLAAARASAAHGGGPWGPVSATPTALSMMRPASTGPNLTFGVIMTYDAADGYVLAVSLNASAGPFNNTYGPTDLTWKFVAGNWSEISTVGQVPATLSPGLVFDAHDGYVLLYGGRLMDTGATNAPLTNQTWSYRAGVWSNLSSSSNPAPWAVDFANLVYDAADEYVLLYNEIGITPTDPAGYLNTTWTYASGVWTNITATAGAPPQMLGAMAYDALDQYVLYFGGYTWWNQLSNATWTFHGGVWYNVSLTVTGAPSPRMNFGIDYDSLHGEVVLYGGIDLLYAYNGSEFSYETWSYAAGAWSLLPGNGSIWSIQSMAYDAADNESVLLGSNSSFYSPPNVVTWIYQAGGWTVAAPIFVRSLWTTDVGHAFTIDVTRSVNEGGLAYQYSDLPPGCTGADTAMLNCTPSSTGTYLVTLNITGAAGFRAESVTTIQVNPAPMVLGFSGTPSSGEIGIAAEINVTAVPGTNPLYYTYTGLPTGCASANTPVLPCDPTVAGTYNITAEITDAVGVTVQATDSFSVAAALAVTSVSTDRSALDVGQPISVTTELNGGVAPYTYDYTGLPAGCGPADSSQLTCRPSATGSFSIAAHTADSLGAIAFGSSGFVVNALPSVVAFVPSTGTISSGGSISMSTTIDGGTAPFQYRYSGLPIGCAATDGALVECSAVPSGNYTVEVSVSDATGATANGTMTFVALAAPAKILPSTPGPAQGPGFWWGFAIATIAIAAAAGVGGYRLRLARQGEEIVRKLRADEEGSTGSPGSPEMGSSKAFNGEEE